ncbi:MAG TPA: hypothetical protein VF993_06015 [Myxococcales bacterium]
MLLRFASWRRTSTSGSHLTWPTTADFTYSPEDGTETPPLEGVGTEEKALFDEVEHRLALQRSLSPQ